MEIFKAKNIMTTDVAYVKKQTPIYEAIRILVEKNITGLPVVNDDMTLAGIISEKDVLTLLYNVGSRSGTVKEFMSRKVVCFDIEDNLVDVCDCLVNNHFRRVTITSEGRLAGIISRKDIIKFILELRHKDKSAG